MRIVVLSNDVIPGMGIPVAAPGMRAWGLAEGLRAHGHDVRILVDERVASIAWGVRWAMTPVGQPAGSLLIAVADVTAYVRAHDVEALIVTNSNHVAALGDLGRCALVYDFFAPKMLELAEQAPPEEREEQLAALEKRKLEALGRADLVIVNGRKKLDYVDGWLTRSGSPGTPRAVVNMPVPRMRPRPLQDGRVHVIVSGYFQPWSTPGAWLDGLRPYLAEGSMILHVLMGQHWGQSEQGDIPPALRRFLEDGTALRHGPRGFTDFRRLMSRCHLNVDVFDRNPERELAMVTRSTTALACGVPTMHVPFTEVSEFIREYDAGWLVDGDDVPGMARAFGEALDPNVLTERRAGAERVADEVLDPERATAPLAGLLDELSAARKENV